MISTGCIVSGSRVQGSILCPNVRVHSFATIENSILMPGVRVGRHARIRRAIIDRDVLIPRGAVIGYNEEDDRARHTVTEGGVVVVTADEEPASSRSRPTRSPSSRAPTVRSAGGAAALRSNSQRLHATCGATRMRPSGAGISGDNRTSVSERRRAMRPRQERHRAHRDIHGREILDSRGNPTVEVDVTLDSRRHAAGPRCPRARRPARARRSNCATATRAATSARACSRPSAHVNGEIRAALSGQTADQRAIDAQMIALDGTPNLGRLGANAMLGVSMALARAAAAGTRPAALRAPRVARAGPARAGGPVLPVPMMNILNGGAHADSNVDFQEFMVMPVGAPTFSDALRAGVEIFHALRAC